MSRTFTAKVEKAPGMDATGIVLPFDPTEVWGRTRVPVRATVNGYEYRTTIARMSGRFLIPLAREHREAANTAAGQTVEVTLVEDAAERTVEVPPDLASALDAAGLRDRFDRLAYTHRKEHVRAIEEAKKPETRARRVEKALDMLRAK